MKAGWNNLSSASRDLPVRLHRLNPLAKIAAAAPGMIALVVLRDPLRAATLLVLALAVIAIGARLPAKRMVGVLVAPPIAVLAFSFSFGLWSVTEAPGTVLFALGPYQFSTSMWLAGLTTALRLVAIVALSLIAGLTMTGNDLARALVQQCRLPYRFAWAGIAAIRFVPRLRVEREIIRAARRVRGIAPDGGVLARLRERFGFALPLMVSSIRHAERVGLAMDSRGFGAYPTRTERSEMRWLPADTIFVVASWAVTVAVLSAPAILLALELSRGVSP